MPSFSSVFLRCLARNGDSTTNHSSLSGSVGSSYSEREEKKDIFSLLSLPTEPIMSDRVKHFCFFTQCLNGILAGVMYIEPTRELGLSGFPMVAMYIGTVGATLIVHYNACRMFLQDYFMQSYYKKAHGKKFYSYNPNPWVAIAYSLIASLTLAFVTLFYPFEGETDVELGFEFGGSLFSNTLTHTLPVRVIVTHWLVLSAYNKFWKLALRCCSKQRAKDFSESVVLNGKLMELHGKVQSTFDIVGVYLKNNKNIASSILTSNEPIDLSKLLRDSISGSKKGRDKVVSYQQEEIEAKLLDNTTTPGKSDDNEVALEEADSCFDKVDPYLRSIVKLIGQLTVVDGICGFDWSNYEGMAYLAQYTPDEHAFEIMFSIPPIVLISVLVGFFGGMAFQKPYIALVEIVQGRFSLQPAIKEYPIRFTLFMLLSAFIAGFSPGVSWKLTKANFNTPSFWRNLKPYLVPNSYIGVAVFALINLYDTVLNALTEYATTHASEDTRFLLAVDAFVQSKKNRIKHYSPSELCEFIRANLERGNLLLGSTGKDKVVLDEIMGVKPSAKKDVDASDDGKDGFSPPPSPSAAANKQGLFGDNSPTSYGSSGSSHSREADVLSTVDMSV